MASTAADVASTQAQERPRCPTCGGMLQERGKQVRKLVTYGEQSVQLTRSYGYCPTCGVGFFPPL
jgi:YgiT-type zinc finger domain-containing protein